MLRTYGSIPCWRIVFFTFRRCMSFYTTWTHSGPPAGTPSAERLQMRSIPAGLSPPVRYPANRPKIAGGRMKLEQLKRRKVVTLLGGAAAWRVTARAQRVAVLMIVAA